MKKVLKITLIVLGVFIGIIVIDTLQAKFINSSPILKIRENIDDKQYIDKGLLVNHYHCYNEDITVFKNTKYFCDVSKDDENQKYVNTIDNLTFELDILNNWHYEEIKSVDDSYKFALKLYKDSQDKYAILYVYNNLFSVCGTGRTIKEITLNNGFLATIGFYGDPVWSDISFYNLNPNIAFINNGLEEDDSKEFLEIVKTFNLTT